MLARNRLARQTKDDGKYNALSATRPAAAQKASEILASVTSK
jgi:hypothetical protein